MALVAVIENFASSPVVGPGMPHTARFAGFAASRTLAMLAPSTPPSRSVRAASMPAWVR